MEAFEQLLSVAQTQPCVGSKETGARKTKKDKTVDSEALSVWESALTKYNDLETVFAKGPDAKAALEMELVTQIAADLEKDYEVSKEDTGQRAIRVVKSQVGKVWVVWLRKQKGCS